MLRFPRSLLVVTTPHVSTTLPYLSLLAIDFLSPGQRKTIRTTGCKSLRKNARVARVTRPVDFP